MHHLVALFALAGCVSRLDALDPALSVVGAAQTCSWRSAADFAGQGDDCKAELPPKGAWYFTARAGDRWLDVDYPGGLWLDGEQPDCELGTVEMSQQRDSSWMLSVDYRDCMPSFRLTANGRVISDEK